MERKAKIRLIALEAAWTALITVSCFFPLFFIFAFIPLIILTAHFIARGLWLNAAVLTLILVAACILSGGDYITVLFSVLISAGVSGAILGLKQKSYFAGAALTGAVMIIAALIPSVLMSAFNKKKPADFVYSYVSENLESGNKIFSPAAQIKIAARLYYLYYAPADGEKSAPGSETYETDVKEVFGAKAWSFSENKFFYALTGTGAVAGIFCYLAALFMNREYAAAKPSAFKDMRLDRKFFLYVFLPVFAFSFLGYIDAMSQVAAAVFFSFAAVPAAYSAFALLAHTTDRVKLKSVKSILYIALCALGFISAVSPSVLIGVSFLGAADMILNLRKLIDFALDDGTKKS